MANISTDFSTWSGTAASNQPDSGDTATVQADLQAIQAALRTIFPSVNAAVTPTHTELNYVDGVTSAIQTQLDAKATLVNNTFTGTQTITGRINTARGSVTMHATTMDLWAQANIIDGTGSAVTITAIANAPQAGATRRLYPITGTTITHGATFDVEGGANYTTAAGDALTFEAITTTTYKVWVEKKDGTPIAGGSAATTTSSGIVELATTAEMGLRTDTTRAVTAVSLQGIITSGTPIATTSGTSHDFTGIPSWVKRITCNISGVSTNGTSPLYLQLGDSGGIEATGYAGAVMNNTGAGHSTTGFDISFTNSAASVWHGSVILSLLDASTNTWCAMINVGSTASGLQASGGGSKSLSATLDRVRLTTGGGTDTFDAGSFNITYE